MGNPTNQHRIEHLEQRFAQLEERMVMNHTILEMKHSNLEKSITLFLENQLKMQETLNQLLNGNALPQNSHHPNPSLNVPRKFPHSTAIPITPWPIPTPLLVQKPTLISTHPNHPSQNETRISSTQTVHPSPILENEKNELSIIGKARLLQVTLINRKRNTNRHNVEKGNIKKQGNVRKNSKEKIKTKKRRDECGGAGDSPGEIWNMEETTLERRRETWWAHNPQVTESGGGPGKQQPRWSGKSSWPASSGKKTETKWSLTGGALRNLDLRKRILGYKGKARKAVGVRCRVAGVWKSSICSVTGKRKAAEMATIHLRFLSCEEGRWAIGFQIRRNGEKEGGGCGWGEEEIARNFWCVAVAGKFWWVAGVWEKAVREVGFGFLGLLGSRAFLGIMGFLGERIGIWVLFLNSLMTLLVMSAHKFFCWNYDAGIYTPLNFNLGDNISHMTLKYYFGNSSKEIKELTSLMTIKNTRPPNQIVSPYLYLDADHYPP